MLETPFGRIRITADGHAIPWEAEPYACMFQPVAERPVAGCFRIRIPGERYGVICCELIPEDGDIQALSSSGENYEAMEVVRGGIALTIGAEDDHPSFTTELVPNGIRYVLREPVRQVVFGVAWADDYAGPLDNRTWFAADPTLYLSD